MFYVFSNDGPLTTFRNLLYLEKVRGGGTMLDATNDRNDIWASGLRYTGFRYIVLEYTGIKHTFAVKPMLYL